MRLLRCARNDFINWGIFKGNRNISGMLKNPISRVIARSVSDVAISNSLILRG